MSSVLISGQPITGGGGVEGEKQCWLGHCPPSVHAKIYLTSALISPYSVTSCGGLFCKMSRSVGDHKKLSLLIKD